MIAIISVFGRSPQGKLTEIVDHVVPELQRRNVFHREYADDAATFRDELRAGVRGSLGAADYEPA
ncbi:hypothetical protein OG921_02100 [Aldersonia sp. NBC_00410]|uniref:hypothetical protein n=1 Tax=Aldersonia sp. NBC_00410 TaxID=2975954 RepID=UPI00224D8884|nr:hypothetical protein [Aldersonia sp. NBC_00410]MCX5041987.1 hypothetical protein [Aldersonia sp. NBC_00410]